MIFVPVVDQEQKPLMPTIPSRARRWIKSGKATPFWNRGVFCVRLNTEPSGREMQQVAVGIDPGSKREGFTVKSEAHTFLNIEAEAVQHVKKAVETRRIMRRNRRSRKCPYRQDRKNRARGGIPPSTKARWGWKLRLATWLTKMFPITRFVVEDVKAGARKGARRWNQSFSPLEVGKAWFYTELVKLAPVNPISGYETAEMRERAGLKKSSDKLTGKFEAHCIDSWVLANYWTGGREQPENCAILHVVPLRFHRRQLHVMNPAKGGLRKFYGGTRSLGFKRGSLVTHPKWGLVYVGGASKGCLSLYEIATGKRLTQKAKAEVCRFRCFNSWRTIS